MSGWFLFFSASAAADFAWYAHSGDVLNLGIGVFMAFLALRELVEMMRDG